jgi:hypothetical protein
MVMTSISSERLRTVTVWTTALVALFACGCSLFWRMYLDTPILLYLAKQMVQQGAVPYRDFVEMNLPLTYGFFSGIVVVLGSSDLSVAVAQALVVGLVSGGMAYALAGAGRGCAGFGALMGVLRLYSGTWGFTLQRELLALIPVTILLGMGFRVCVIRLRHTLLAAFCLAALTLIKPQVTLYALPALVLMGLRLDGWRARLLNLLIVTGVYSAVLALCAAWLIRCGAWQGFCEVVQYWFLYGQMNFCYVFQTGPERMQGIMRGVAKMVFSPYLALAILSLGVGVRSRALSRRAAWAWCALLAISLVVPALSGQFWGYHRLPFFYLCVVSSGYLMTGPRWSVACAALVALLWCGFTVPRVIAEARSPAAVRLNHGVADFFAEYLKKHAEPGVRVQPIDWADGALHGMLLADARLATRFPYTFYFYHHVSHPLIQRFRATFMDELRKAPPDYLFEVTGAPKPTGLDTRAGFAAFDAWRAEQYRVVAQTAEARIWQWKGAQGRVKEVQAP